MLGKTMNSRQGSNDRATSDSDERSSDIRSSPAQRPEMVTVARRPSGQTGANAALSATDAARATSAHETNRALPKLPRAPSTPPPPTDDADAGELDIALDEIERALAEPEPSAPAATSARPAPNQLPAICTFGRFEILGRIAFGGMAEIFLGRESTNIGATRMLAVKRILPHVPDDPAFTEMFLHEARLAIQLNHPHICPHLRVR